MQRFGINIEYQHYEMPGKIYVLSDIAMRNTFSDIYRYACIRGSLTVKRSLRRILSVRSTAKFFQLKLTYNYL